MLTVPEAAKRTGRHPETIRRWIWSGRLRSEKVSGRHLIPEAELARIDAIDAAGQSLVAWLDKLFELHDREGFRSGVLPSGAELVRAERESH